METSSTRRAQAAKFKSLVAHGVSGLALTVALQAGSTASAFAQSQTAQSQAAAKSPEIEEVVVTGSRLITDGLKAPTPVTVVSSESLQDSTPGSFLVGLEQLPQFANSLHAGTSTLSVTSGSDGNLNLRGIGSQRTLVLIDGQRTAASGISGIPDISAMPKALIQRTDVITGGASAAYGSDAVAGVVNFVVDNKFKGVKGEIQGGITQHGDKKNYSFNLAAGMGFNDDKGHITLSYEMDSDDGLLLFDRPIGYEGWAIINSASVTATNPASPTNAVRILASNVNANNATAGGVITSGPLKDTQFGPGGSVEPYIGGTQRTPLTMVGGSGRNGGDLTGLFAPLKSKGFYGYVSYDIFDAITVFANVSLGSRHIRIDETPNRLNSTQSLTIFAENAYLPASIKAAMATLRITSFQMGRLEYDTGRTYGQNNRKAERYVTGANGEIGGGWSFDSYYAHDDAEQMVYTFADTIMENAFMASDAVFNPNGNGTIICRTTITNPNDGCVPANYFGQGSVSESAIKYITGTEVDRLISRQDAVGASLRGHPFTLWAGDLGVAFGAEWRKANARLTPDAIAASRINASKSRAIPTVQEGKLGGYLLTNQQPQKGGYNVKEAFAEVEVPLAANETWAKSLDLNAAMRVTDYNFSGTVVTWKVGLVYEPIDNLRVRGTRSRDIRAPNIQELFQGKDSRGNQFSDPFKNNQIIPGTLLTSLGNLTLTPEKADTTTIGITYQPDWFQGFRTSLDFYNISVGSAIVQLGGQVIINGCFKGDQTLCALLRRAPTVNGVIGQILEVTNPYLNAGALEARGLDFESSYTFPTADLVSTWGGNLSFRLLLSYLDRQVTTVPGAAGDIVINRAGDITMNMPQVRGSLTATYSNGPLYLTAQERYIGSGVVDKTFTPSDISAEANNVPAFLYTDITARYKLGEGENYEVYGTINNVLNKAPPHQVAIFSLVGTNVGSRGLYDFAGRAFTAGLRFKF